MSAPTTEEVLAGIEARIARFSRLGRFLYDDGSDEAMELLAVVNQRILELDKAYDYLVKHTPGVHDPRLDPSPPGRMPLDGIRRKVGPLPGLDDLEKWLWRSRFNVR